MRLPKIVLVLILACLPLALGLSNRHVCGFLKKTGKVYCWGSNVYSQAGQYFYKNPYVKEAADVTEMFGGPVKQLFLGDAQTCAFMKADGSARCGGQGSGFQLGCGYAANPTWEAPLAVAFKRNLTMISPALHFSCAIDSERSELQCVGLNKEFDRIASGCEENYDFSDGYANALPIRLPAKYAGRKVLDVKGSGVYYDRDGHRRHACMIIEGGIVLCWGSNSQGVIGLKDTTNKHCFPPTEIAVSEEAVYLDVGPSYACVITKSGNVECWGSLTNSGSPVLKPRSMGMSMSVQVSTGVTHECSLRVDGAVFCSGVSLYGEIGVAQKKAGTPELHEEPVRIPGLVATQVVCGAHFTCAVEKGTGKTLCWGHKEFGHVEDEDNHSLRTPSKMSQEHTHIPTPVAGAPDGLTLYGPFPLKFSFGTNGADFEEVTELLRDDITL